MWFKYVAWIWLLAVICCVPTSFANEGQDSANEYSSLVSVRVDGMHHCTGVILAPSWILTSFSCLEGTLRTNLTRITIAYDVENSSLHGENVGSIKYLYHYTEWRNHKPYFGQLFLIELQEPMAEKENMSPVLLPSKDNDLAGKLVEVTGWTLNKTPSSSVIDKQTIKVKVETCSKQVGGSEIALDNICTKYEGDETTGRSFFPGATLMDDETLVGIANWYSKTGDWNAPNVYTKISYYTEWIASKMNDN